VSRGQAASSSGSAATRRARTGIGRAGDRLARRPLDLPSAIGARVDAHVQPAEDRGGGAAHRRVAGADIDRNRRRSDRPQRLMRNNGPPNAFAPHDIHAERG